VGKGPGYIRGKTSKGFAPPPEVLRYFRDKGLRPRFSWLDVWGEEHAHAFTVAKAVELDVLQAFRKTIDKAIAEGQSFETWKANVKPELDKLGWWGRRQVKDPTNAFRKATVDFSAPRRLQTIFWSNMRAARAAGQWERIQRTKRALPLILYVRTASADPRPEHLAFAGRILPVDHPFWRTHFPPNGWGCKCTVRAITGREAESYRGKEGYSYDAPVVRTQKFINRRTGEVTQVPEGIDPGWHTNPGLARARTLTTALQDKLREAGLKRARKTVRDLWASDYPKLLAVLEERVHAPVAVSPTIVEALDSKGAIVTVSNTTLRTKVGKHAVVEISRFALIQQILDRGALVDMGQRGTWAVAWIDGQLWKVALKRSKDGYAYVATFHPIDRRRLPANTVIPELQGEGNVAGEA
jgi:Phage Mu protein F like protein